jgi:hypothetical protein
VKDSTQAMNILGAYDLYQSYNQASRECQCSPNTVRSLVVARGPWAYGVSTSHDRLAILAARHMILVTSPVEESKGLTPFIAIELTR